MQVSVNKCGVVTRPDYEIVTKYLCEWTEDVLELARSKGITLYDLKGKKAKREELESYVKKHTPSLVFLNGHGKEDAIAGHDDRVIVDVASNLSKSIVYARSCDAARLLGSVLVGNGTAAFIGYKRSFILGYSPNKMLHPKEDPIARLFLEPSNLVVTTILKGHSVADAHARAREAMYKNFRRMISSSATFEERHAARWLWSNLNSQVVLGDSSAKM
jgi:hypothetical protein